MAAPRALLRKVYQRRLVRLPPTIPQLRLLRQPPPKCHNSEVVRLYDADTRSVILEFHHSCRELRDSTRGFVDHSGLGFVSQFVERGKLRCR